MCDPMWLVRAQRAGIAGLAYKVWLILKAPVDNTQTAVIEIPQVIDYRVAERVEKACVERGETTRVVALTVLPTGRRGPALVA